MTEEEARKKWCPYAFTAAVTKEFSCNRDHDGTIYKENNCIASDCMMWRWKGNDKKEISTTSGYCGLGGKPC